MSINTNRSRVYLYMLIGLFFLLPIIFFPIPGIGHFSFGYERYKSAILILWALFSAILFFASLRTRYRYRLLGIFLCVFIASYFIWNYFWWLQLEVFLFWTGEKRHGMLFFGSLTIFYVMCRQYIDTNWQKKIEKGILISAMIVCLYAILQFVWLDFVPVRYAQMPWGIGRVFSTFGNPNYLAGYLLMLFPILSQKKFSLVFGYWILFLGVMILTGSVAGMLLTGIYITFLLLKNVKFPKVIKIALVIFLVWGGVFWYYSAGKKLLSLESRFSLWNSFIQTEKNKPLALIIWHGPDTIYTAAEKKEIMLDSAYFPISSKLDSFHNIALDTIFFFGIAGFVAVVYFLVRRWRKISKISQEAIVLGFVFFSLNIPVSVHFLMILYYLSLEKREAKYTNPPKTLR